MPVLVYTILKNKNLATTTLTSIRGVYGEQLHLVQFEEIIAVAGYIQHKSAERTWANAIKYAEVIEELKKQSTLLPMQFSSVISSDEALRRNLESNYEAILKNLELVHSKQEYGLKVTTNITKLKKALTDHSELASTQDVDWAFNSRYKHYLNKKMAEYQKDKALDNFINSLIGSLKEDLSSLNAYYKFQSKLSSDTIVDCNMLLDDSRESQLLELIKDVESRYQDLSFVLTGPWPPYNFIDINMK